MKKVLTLKIRDDQWGTEEEAIAIRALTRCGALPVAYRGGVKYRFTAEGRDKLTQEQILHCQSSELDFDGYLGEYWMILPASVAGANVPAGFPDRTYIDENEEEQVRKVQDYIHTYYPNTDNTLYLCRCTYKSTNDSLSGTALNPDDFKRWLDIARNQSAHTAVAGQWLIEREQALELLAGDYAQETE